MELKYIITISTMCVLLLAILNYYTHRNGKLDEMGVLQLKTYVRMSLFYILANERSDVPEAAIKIERILRIDESKLKRKHLVAVRKLTFEVAQHYLMR